MALDETTGTRRPPPKKSKPAPRRPLSGSPFDTLTALTKPKATKKKRTPVPVETIRKAAKDWTFMPASERMDRAGGFLAASQIDRSTRQFLTDLDAQRTAAAQLKKLERERKAAIAKAEKAMKAPIRAMRPPDHPRREREAAAPDRRHQHRGGQGHPGALGRPLRARLEEREVARAPTT